MKTRKTSLALTLLMSVLSAPSYAESVEPSLTIWTGKSHSQMQLIAEQFTKNTGVNVDVKRPVDITGNFEIQARNGEGPDVIFWPHDRIGDWANAGLISELRPSQTLIDSAVGYAWDAVKVEGKIYGYPIGVEAISLIYNKALISQPPKSFEEIFALDLQLQEQHQSKAILWDYNNTYYTWPLLAADGAYVFAKQGEQYNVKDTGVNHPSAMYAGHLLKRMLDQQIMPRNADYSIMDAKFVKGEVAMVINGPWYWDELKSVGMDFGVAPLPQINGKPAKAFVGIWSAVVNSATTNRQLVDEFLNYYLMTVDNQRLLFTSGDLGAMANLQLQNELADNPKVQAVYASAAQGEPMPNAAAMGKFWAAMATTLTNITTGRQGVESALNAAAKRIIR
ncbi:maltose/maltodextrin ABC transporter substrate-binding protein MalE [Agarivorans sp. MS3-6]|uniref:maltose/maltodextrin ABC transporter substrate-binding protein MalE n=1 Tax=Agarivorans sp. TSD2052 TaxID=2937286 RepID=UPI00200DED9D|nr:maltose/maltodextrin ABC transporter substrate-binding protein MalE [Agarivorans sp. TSD2052]UPW19738.1 maltose/maltodextrin ABC transporter substrate-binding protein MalE [Agarivorans sp. TSD2052]